MKKPRKKIFYNGVCGDFVKRINEIYNNKKQPKPITDHEKKGCLGKVKHKSELAARHQVDHDMKEVKKPHKYDYYKCEFCGYWHCGHE